MATKTVTYNGVTYNVPIGEANANRVRQIYNNLAKKERAEVWDGAALQRINVVSCPRLELRKKTREQKLR